jgi:peptidoglycan-associated lipoprotein
VDPFVNLTLAPLQAQRPIGDVFFEYDSSSLSDAARGTLQKGADFLRQRMSVRARVEGHADERGTNEYNLALGERRANAVRDYLVSLGIAGNRLEVLSKGEEEPQCRQTNEACWSQNRRGTFIYTAK